MNWYAVLDARGILMLFSPLVLSLAALLAAWLGRLSGWRQDVESYSSRILFFESAAATRTGVPAPQSTLPENAPAIESTPVLSPLEKMQGEAVTEIAHFRGLLIGLLHSTGASEAPFRSALDGFDEMTQNIRASGSETQIEALQSACLISLSSLMRDVLSRCDLDLNPDQNSRPVEDLVRKMLTASELDLIAPVRGAAFEPALHTRLGVVAGTLEQRGTIGQVRCRGLRDRDGNVLLKAEILEYD